MLYVYIGSEKKLFGTKNTPNLIKMQWWSLIRPDQLWSASGENSTILCQNRAQKTVLI